MKKILFVIVLIILFGGLGIWFWFNQLPPKIEPQTPIPNLISTSTPTTDTRQIIIDVPQNYERIANPLLVSGKARGTWYFEASFPARVEDANGVVLGQTPITAQANWMTTEFVPFIGSISFTTSTTHTGFVIFAKDNPSGLPEYDAEVRVPITFLQP